MINMKTVGILVGHYGRGTGASHGDFDEWKLAMQDASLLADRLNADKIVNWKLIALDKDSHPWDLVQKLWPMGSKYGDKKLREQWARREHLDLAIELHYNSHTTQFWTSKKTGQRHPIQGHQVMIHTDQVHPHSIDLAHSLQTALNSKLGNRDRGIKKASLSILRRLKHIPCVLVEPAFIFESSIREPSWPDVYSEALQDGIYDFLGLV